MSETVEEPDGPMLVGDVRARLGRVAAGYADRAAFNGPECRALLEALDDRATGPGGWCPDEEAEEIDLEYWKDEAERLEDEIDELRDRVSELEEKLNEARMVLND